MSHDERLATSAVAAESAESAESAVPAVSATSPFRIVGGSPTASELAAVTAVLSVALEELATERERDSGVGQSGWQRSQRAIRKPLAPGYGAWRSFSG